jgi:REP element-mobilizing transposase RayT
MPNTYTQLYAHVVFAVSGRDAAIRPAWKENLYRYIAGIVSNKNQKLMIINGMPDHIHILLGFKPDCSLSDLVRDIKSSSSKWVRENKLATGKFEWQTGFGAFSVSPSAIERVVDYIKNQEEHHRKKRFIDEYIEFLRESKIDFNPEYIFKNPGIAPPDHNGDDVL